MAKALDGITVLEFASSLGLGLRRDVDGGAGRQGDQD